MRFHFGRFFDRLIVANHQAVDGGVRQTAVRSCSAFADPFVVTFLCIAEIRYVACKDLPA
jgi:hypothetical protein